MNYPSNYPSVVGELQVFIQLDADSPYIQMDADMQHTVKMDLMMKMNTVLAPAEPYLKCWSQLPVVMDPNYHDTIPTMTERIDREIATLNEFLGSSGASVRFQRGELAVPLWCVHTPDGGHQCVHTFALQKKDGGNTFEDWSVDSTMGGSQVVAPVRIQFTWNTPGMPMDAAGGNGTGTTAAMTEAAPMHRGTTMAKGPTNKPV